MLLTNNDYEDFSAIANQITDGTDMGVFYTESGGNVTGIWAVFVNGSTTVICGGHGVSVGITVTALLADFPTAIKITTDISAVS